MFACGTDVAGRWPCDASLGGVYPQAVLAVASLLAAASLAGAHVSKLHGIVPPANPAANVAPNPNYDHCTAGGSCTAMPPCYSASPSFAPKFTAAACESAELAAIDNARAKEGVAPMTLPRTFNSLTRAEQLLVVIDLERVGRGLPPFAGLVASLDAIAQSATHPPGAPAGSFEDPTFPNGFTVAPASAFAWRGAGGNGGFSCDGSGQPGAAIAAGGQISALDADYGWMYDDGYGGSNFDCRTPGASGCWGHRDNILGRYPRRSAFTSASFGAPINVGPARRTTLVMGAGNLQPVKAGEAQGNWTAIFAAVSGHRPKLVYSWKQAVAAGAR